MQSSLTQELVEQLRERIKHTNATVELTHKYANRHIIITYTDCRPINSAHLRAISNFVDYHELEAMIRIDRDNNLEVLIY